MRKPARAWTLISLLVAGGCSAGAASGPQSGGPQGSGSGAGFSGAPVSGESSSGGQTGSSAAAGVGTGGSGSADAMSGSTTGSTASAGSSGADGASGSTGALTSGSTEAGAAPEGGNTGAGPFTCNLVLGLFTTSQWFNGTNPGGATKTFLMDGVDMTRWESKTQKYSYVEKWISPTSSLWSLNLNNPCASNSTTPDRVIFVGFSPDTTQGKSQAGWEMVLNSVIATIEMKYPSAKEIDILTMGRAPNNMLCPNNSDAETIIPAYEDAAYQAVADASGGLIVVGPTYYVPDCNSSYIFANDTDYTTTASNYIATEVAAYYVAHP